MDRDKTTMLKALRAAIAAGADASGHNLPASCSASQDRRQRRTCRRWFAVHAELINKDWLLRHSLVVPDVAEVRGCLSEPTSQLPQAETSCNPSCPYSPAQRLPRHVRRLASMHRGGRPDLTPGP
jgi:hypothetical protein